MLNEAITLASSLHQSEERENGDPYILHPIRVMMAVRTTEERIVAILHDIIEDTAYTIVDLEELHDFDPRIILAIEAITRGEGELYGNYIDRLSGNRLASVVKLADLRDNMNVLELRELNNHNLSRLEKYHSAYFALGGLSR